MEKRKQQHNESVKRMYNALLLLKEEYKDWISTPLTKTSAILKLSAAQCATLINMNIIVYDNSVKTGRGVKHLKWNDGHSTVTMSLAERVINATRKLRKSYKTKDYYKKKLREESKITSHVIKDRQVYKIPELPADESLQKVRDKFETFTACKCECHFNEVFEDRIYGRIRDTKWYPMCWDMKGEPSNGNTLHKLIVKDPILSELRNMQNQLAEQLKKVSDEIKQRSNN